MRASADLGVEAPFHLEATVRLLQRRPVDRVDRFEEGSYLRLWATEEGAILSRVLQEGRIDAPRLRLDFLGAQPSPALAKALGERLSLVLALDRSTEAFRSQAMEVPGLAPVVAALRGMRPPRFPSLFEAIARTVPFQQLSLDAGVSLLGRLVERCGQQVELAGSSYYTFPVPEAVSGLSLADFRGMGFSRAKGRCLIEAAQRLESGALDEAEIEALPSEEAYRKLLELPGIGPWSASLILLRGLGRLESFPSGDVGVRRGLAAILREEHGSFAVEGYADSFGDQKGMLYFCSLGAQLLSKELIHPAPPLPS